MADDISLPIDHLSRFLGQDALCELITLYACHGRHADAWKLVQQPGNAELLCLAIDKSDIPANPVGHTPWKRSHDEVWGPFGTFIGAAIAQGGPDGKAMEKSAFFWLIQPKSFSEGFAAGLGAKGVKFALQHIPMEGQGISFEEIEVHAELLSSMPGLLEALIDREAASPEVAKALHGRPGFPLVRGLAGSLVDASLVERALARIEMAGHDTAEVIARRWPRSRELPLPPKLRSSSALQAALMVGNERTVRLLAACAPQLDIAQEAAQARAVIAVAEQAYPHMATELASRSAKALALSEAIQLELGIAAPLPKPKRRAGNL